MCCISKHSRRFAGLGTPKRIWAIPAVHGHLDSLTDLHDRLLPHIEPGDRLIYLGNYTGYGEHAADCIEELLTFRRMVLSLPGMLASDLIYLRGAQEEMWQRLLQLQFTPNPLDALLWMLGNGLSATLYSYGLSPHDGIESCRGGVMGVTKWTNTIRAAMRARAGHETLFTHMRRAAYTSPDEAAFPMLFVPAGLDAQRPLPEQGDDLWWNGEAFDSIDTAYAPFQKVVRGYDPAHRGVHMNCITATIDAGCGFGGPLLCTGFNPDGSVAATLEA
ncbi:MAG: hypothetical protein R3D66_04255 [Alphaproteobacteria bacterium]